MKRIPSRDIDALRIVAGVNKLGTPRASCIVVHTVNGLLDYIKPDIVHVLLYKKGRVKNCGTPGGFGTGRAWLRLDKSRVGRIIFDA